MALRRPKKSERGDIAAEKIARKRQTDADREEEKAQRRAEEAAERENIRLIRNAQPYEGRHQL